MVEKKKENYQGIPALIRARSLSSVFRTRHSRSSYCTRVEGREGAAPARQAAYLHRCRYSLPLCRACVSARGGSVFRFDTRPIIKGKLRNDRPAAAEPAGGFCFLPHPRLPPTPAARHVGRRQRRLLD